MHGPFGAEFGVAGVARADAAAASKLDAFKPVIDDILRADLDAPRKLKRARTAGKFTLVHDAWWEAVR